MKFRNLVNGSTALIMTAGVAFGLSFAPAFVSAQDVDAQNAESQNTSAFTLTSPLQGGERQNRQRANSQPFLAEELGIPEEVLSAAREAARELATDSEDFQTQLAAQLNVPVETLQAAQEAAREAAREAALADAIEEGRITEEEAALREAQRDLREAIDRNQVVADALNISVDELNDAVAAGASIRELAEDLGVDREVVQTALEDAYAAQVADAVAEGTITQEQADAILADDEPNNNRRRSNGRAIEDRGNRAPQGGQPEGFVPDTAYPAPEDNAGGNEPAVDSPTEVENPDGNAEAPRQRGNRGQRRGNAGGASPTNDDSNVAETPTAAQNDGPAFVEPSGANANSQPNDNDTSDNDTGESADDGGNGDDNDQGNRRSRNGGRSGGGRGRNG